MSRSSIETTHYYYAPNPYINDDRTPPDTKLLDQTLGTPALLSYGTACTAVLLACEVSRGLIAGALWGAAEAAAVCGLPTATAYLTRDTIAEEFRKTGSLTPLDAFYFGAGPASAAAGTLAAHMGIRTLTHDRIRRLAKYLEEGKPRKISFLKRRLARKYVVEYFDTLFKDTGLAEQLDEATKIKILANTTKQQLADILAAFTKLRSELGDEIVDDILDNLKKGDVEAAAGAIDEHIEKLRQKMGRQIEEEISDIERIRENAAKKVEEVKPDRSFLRELAESAMCSIPAFLAGTLAAQATAGDLFLPDIETLHVALTPTGIKVGDVEVG